MRTIVVSGALGNKPGNGGNAWSRLSWVRGFQDLGFDVYLVEQIAGAASVAADSVDGAKEPNCTLTYFEEVVAAFDLRARSALVSGDGAALCGLTTSEIEEVAAEADLLLNIGGHLTAPPLRRAAKRSAYFDDDPGYTQFWQATGEIDLRGHDFYFTIGANIGEAGCGIPTGGVRWRHTRPPVTLWDWPVCKAGDRNRLTTVASWRGPYGPVVHDGTTFGLKVHEFRKVVELPDRAPQEFEIALDIDPADQKDQDLLGRHHWRIVDPQKVARDPAQFRSYVQASGGEFSVAQGIYVQTGSGWFSDRTVRYLASGKPALVQDTGFSHLLPVGEGLMAFRTIDDAADGARQIACNYERHCEAARQIEETYFDSRMVVGELIDQVGIAP